MTKNNRSQLLFALSFAVFSPILFASQASAQIPPQEIYQFLPSASELQVGGGGGIVFVRNDEVRCYSSQIASPGGAVDTTNYCTNSRGGNIEGPAAAELMKLLPPATFAGGGGGVVMMTSGAVTCSLEQISPPGGAVSASFNCQ